MGKVKNDSLGSRMKAYESISRNFLTRRVPVIIRIDGKAFHTFTRGLQKPFDTRIMDAMRGTMKFLCQNIQGCVFGYTQSDEITLVLTDYETIATDAWFGYNVQKMCSIAASMATLEFNRLFREYDELPEKFDSAMFDARAFSVPKEEVCNCLIWRQQDATRNSIEACGQASFTYKELHGKNCNEIQEMLWSQRGINWNNIPTDCKRGSCCYHTTKTTTMPDPRNPSLMITVERKIWFLDLEPPIFTQDRAYIEKWI